MDSPVPESPDSAGQRRIRASDGERDQVLRALQNAHAAGRLDLAEFDERQGEVMRCRYLDELGPIVADLPEGDALELVPTSRPVPATPTAGRRSLVPQTDTPVVTTVAVMSGRRLRPAPGTESVNGFQWWGGDDINLADCMGPGVVVRINLVSIMAGSNITVPPGVRVLDETVNIMAGNHISDDASGDGSNGTVILGGFSWWAGHHVGLGDGPDD